MSINTGLYIHIPWCMKKCPYCDFNSHLAKGEILENDYINKLVADFQYDYTNFSAKKITSIFIGGGTPSLISAKAYDNLFNRLNKLASWDNNVEITLEANPGTVDNRRFKDYRNVGINRLSIGVQSFNNSALKKLGRIHDADNALRAIENAHLAGFANINIDIMYGLPQQTTAEALKDLETAINCQPNHLSWYELTIEPNTIFYKKPPHQPEEDIFIDIETKGKELLAAHGFSRYEISAYGKNQARCLHNLNYWQYGDYYGIGAGAHSKLTLANNAILRLAKARMPEKYMASTNFIVEKREIVSMEDIVFEYMLNTCRLIQKHNFADFQAKTSYGENVLLSYLKQAEKKGYININHSSWHVTKHGLQYNNDLMQLFVPKI